MFKDQMNRHFQKDGNRTDSARPRRQAAFPDITTEGGTK